MSRKGIWYGIGAYAMWGLFPVYFKALQQVPALEIMFHRVVWSFFLVAFLMLLRGEWSELKDHVTVPDIWVIYTLAAVLLALNWLVYIYAINTDHIVEGSLGYFINPLLSVAMGVVFLREKLRPAQWIPIGMAAAGVVYLTIFYGRIRGRPGSGVLIRLDAVKDRSIGFVAWLDSGDSHLVLAARGISCTSVSGKGFRPHRLGASLLLAAAGVITALPSCCSLRRRSIPLYMVGMLRTSPHWTISIGRAALREPFTQRKCWVSASSGLRWPLLGGGWQAAAILRSHLGGYKMKYRRFGRTAGWSQTSATAWGMGNGAARRTPVVRLPATLS
jgi:chloramphenicol-sensitive protein RarD